MKVKTYTADTIRQAMAAATLELGEDVVLIESIAPKSGQPARITVLADQRIQSADRPEAIGTAGSGAYARQKQSRYSEAPAAPAQIGAGIGVEEVDEYDLVDLKSAPAAKTSADRRRALFASTPPPAPAPPAESAHLAAVKSELRGLQQQMQRLEARFDGALIGASNRWVVHPLFQKMLKTGLRPETVSSVFNAAADAGLSPESSAEELLWTVARQLRDKFAAHPKPYNGGAMVAIGFAGSGKTSLLLKLARHDAFFGKRSTVVISILPDPSQDESFLSPAEWYRHFGVPVRTVRNESEMAASLKHVSHFDHVLVDTPPLPSDAKAAHQKLSRVRRLLEPLLPLEVHFVVNATRELPAADSQLIARLPLYADCVALSHLDETLAWGRIAEWVTALERPVRFVSNSRRIPDGIAAFNAAWFVEQMLEF